MNLNERHAHAVTSQVNVSSFKILRGICHNKFFIRIEYCIMFKFHFLPDENDNEKEATAVRQPEGVEQPSSSVLDTPKNTSLRQSRMHHVDADSYLVRHMYALVMNIGMRLLLTTAAVGGGGGSSACGVVFGV